MSGSPKYSSYRLQQEQERRLAELRRRQAEQEAAQRRAEAERQRRERLAQAQRAASQELAALRRRLSALPASAVSRFAPAGWMQQNQERLSRIEQQLGKHPDEKPLRQAQQALAQLDAEIRQVTAQIEAAQLSEQLAEEAAALAGLRAQLAAMDSAQAAKFDPTGRQEVAAMLERAENLVGQQALSAARQEIARIRQRLEKHQREVNERLARWTELRDQTAVAVAEAGDQLAGLQADPVVQRWCSGRVQALVPAQQHATGLLASEQFAEARAAAQALVQQTEAIVAAAQAQQLDEERRQYVVDGIVAALKQHGLIVQAGYPALEHPQDPGSATVIQAERLGGGAIAISIPQRQDEDIFYDVAGFAFQEETGRDGQIVRSCDEAEEQIERVHDALNEAFGIEMSELRWDGKDPTRIRRAADRLPSSRPESRRFGV